MKTKFNNTNLLQKSTMRIALIVFVFFINFQTINALAGMRTPPAQKIDAIIIGDRIVDIAYNLGVLPKAMSVRGSQWGMAKQLKISSQILGCPTHTTVKKKETIPNALKEMGIHRVIVEKSDKFCLYSPDVNPTNIAKILKDTKTKIEYVDFTQGLESAIRQTATLLEKEDKADALIKKYNKDLAKAQKKLPKNKLGKKILILNGTYHKDTGKTTIRVEAPGLYSDIFFLKPMGCTNVGDAFKPSDGKIAKGYYPVQKRKNGMVLKPIIKANPDIIVITGNAYGVQKNLADYINTNPELANVPAIKNLAIYKLPLYVDSSVLEFPYILTQWAMALKN